MDVQTKRIYDAPAADDGYRVLVDRLWPRGMTKERSGLDLWLKDIAPSTDLRKWFGHDPEKWDAFKHRYASELEERPEAVATLRDAAQRGRVTLLFAARDTRHNEAVALKEYLMGQEDR